jgi:hypothetical protein
MAFSALAWPPASLLPAQGRFAVQAKMAWLSCVLFFIMVVIGAYFKAGIGVGIAVAVYWMINASVTLRVSLWPTELGWRDMLRSVKASFLCGAIAVGLASVARIMLPARFQNGWFAIFLVTLISFAIYGFCLRGMDEEAWKELVLRISQLGKRVARLIGPRAPRVGDTTPNHRRDTT